MFCCAMPDHRSLKELHLRDPDDDPAEDEHDEERHPAISLAELPHFPSL